MNLLTKTCAFVRTVHQSIFLKNFATVANTEKSTTTYHELYMKWIKKFTMAAVPEPRESAGFIFSHMLGKKTFALVPHADLNKTISDSEISMINDLCGKRLARMPVQYIIGEWDFFGINLKMKPPVFIPRPETEEFAGHVLKCIDHKLQEFTSSGKNTVKVLEVGCGTGAITLSLLNKLEKKPVDFVAVDAASHAVDLTKENLEILNLDRKKVKVLLHKLERHDSVLKKMSPFDIIVSNPPYIPTADMKALSDEIQRYEDHIALYGGSDGLDAIHDILHCADNILADDGSVWFEVDPTHPPILSKNYKHLEVTTYIDMFGKERFCHLKRR